MRIRPTVICDLYGCTIFSHIISNGKILLNTNCVFWFPLQFCVESFLCGEEMREMGL